MGRPSRAARRLRLNRLRRRYAPSIQALEGRLLLSTADFVGADTTTQGNWRNAYGADGYDIAQDSSGNNPSLPSYAQVSMTGESNINWGTTLDDVDPLQDAAGTSTIVAFWYSNTTFDININLTDGQAHEVAVYASNP